LVELVEEAAASDSPKVATAMAAGGGRSGKAVEAAMQIARGSTGAREESERGWAGSVTDPDPSRAAKPSPSGLVGPDGQVGRKGFANWV
jgi:hypothetical protein